jgi:hypothetical protein
VHGLPGHLGVLPFLQYAIGSLDWQGLVCTSRGESEPATVVWRL